MLQHDHVTERHGITLGQVVRFRYLGADDHGTVIRLTTTKAVVWSTDDISRSRIRSIAYRQIRESDVYREK